MVDYEFILAQLAQVEAQAMLTAQSARTLMTTVERLQPQVGPEEDADGNCLHPIDARIAAPAMGAPGAFHCQRCNRRITPKETS